MGSWAGDWIEVKSYDVEQSGSAGVGDSGGLEVRLEYDTGTPITRHIAMLFSTSGVTGVVSSSELIINVDGTDLPTGDPGTFIAIRVYAIDVGDTASLPTTIEDYDALARTTAYASRTLYGEDATTAVGIDVQSVIQEILDRVDFFDGAGIGLLVEIQATSSQPYYVTLSSIDPSSLSIETTVANDGELDVTLDDTTLAAASSLSISGSVSATMADTAGSAAGSLLIDGSVSAGLDDTASSIVGTVNLSGDVAATLDDVDGDSESALSLSGTVGVSLEGTTASAASVLSIAGSVSSTIEDTAVSSVGSLQNSGDLAATVDDTAVSSTGSLAITGTSGVALDDVSSTISGDVDVSGTLSATTDDIASSIEASLPISGSVSATLGDAASESETVLSISGTLDVELESTAVTSDGASDNSGYLYATLEDSSVSSDASLAITGAVSSTLEETGAFSSIETTSPIVAEVRWRRRLRDWSAICDNVMKLDRTTSLEEAAFRLNQYGICAPVCEMCVTPYPQIGDVNLTCDLRYELQKYMVLPPPPPARLTLPAQFVAEIMPGQFTSGVDSSTNQFGQGTCLRVGTPIENILERSKTKTFIMRGNELFGWNSDEAEFGETTVVLNFSARMKNGSGGTQIMRRTTTRKRTMLIWYTLQVRNNWDPQNCTWFFTHQIRPKIGSDIVTDTGWVYEAQVGPADLPGEFPFGKWLNPMSSYRDLWSILPFQTYRGQLARWAIHTVNPSVDRQTFQEINQYRNAWDPFAYHQGAAYCGLNDLMESVVWNVFQDYENWWGTAGKTTRTIDTNVGEIWGYMSKLSRRE